MVSNGPFTMFKMLSHTFFIISDNTLPALEKISLIAFHSSIKNFLIGSQCFMIRNAAAATAATAAITNPIGLNNALNAAPSIGNNPVTAAIAPLTNPNPFTTVDNKAGTADIIGAKAANAATAIPTAEAMPTIPDVIIG